jgi:NAD(P)-dependent dehydrogenase (short-subunit alcohol dehydrogenase family)
MSLDLEGAKVLVTGGSSGLGEALAVGLAERGAVVGICARRSERLDAVVERLPPTRDRGRWIWPTWMA